MATFRVLRGSHSQREPDGTIKTYQRGDYVISDTDLAERLGVAKFRKVSDDDMEEKVAKKNDPGRPIVEPKPRNDGLDDMTVAQLKELADQEDYDLGNAKTKAEIVEAIRNAT